MAMEQSRTKADINAFLYRDIFSSSPKSEVLASFHEQAAVNAGLLPLQILSLYCHLLEQSLQQLYLFV